MSRRKKNALRNGRNGTPQGRFARLPHSLLQSAAYRSLTPNARALLVEVVALFNGTNNGTLWLSEEDAAKAMGVACRKAARKAFQELSEAGLIAMTKDAFYSVKAGAGRARCWRINWEFNHADCRPASNEWIRYQPTEPGAAKRAQRGSDALAKLRHDQMQNQITRGKSPHTSQISEVVWGKSPHTSQTVDEKLPKIPQVVWGDSPQHIAITMGNSAARSSWTPVSGDGTCETALKLWKGFRQPKKDAA